MVKELWPHVPYGLFNGNRAMTTQGYVECNVKNGVQFELSSGIVTLTAGASRDLIFITGAKPVIIKNRVLRFNGLQLSTRIFRSPAYTGGTPSTIYNLNDINPVATTVQALTGAAVTDVGTEFGAPTWDIGSSDIGNNQISIYTSPGVERVLRPNTTYLQRITNTSASSQLISTSLTWFEGEPDLPLEE